MVWFLVTLAMALAVAAFSLFLYLVQRHDMRQITQDLMRLNQLGARIRLNLPSPSKETKALVDQVNRVIDGKNAAMEEYQRNDRELRSAIENISHDLRTPLTSIMGYLQLLEDPSATQEERAQYLSVMKNRASALKTLISMFYELSRLQAGEYPLEPEPLDLSPLLCEQLAAYYNDFEDRGLLVSVDVPALLPPVLADPKAVMRIVGNLIQNILRHGVSRVSVRAYLESGQVVTAFCNDTHGLSPEDASRIFERFFTADRMRTGQNTGLGLAIVKMLVEQMKGRIEAHMEGQDLYILIRWHQA